LGHIKKFTFNIVLPKFLMALKALALIQKNTDLLTKSNYLLSDQNHLSDPILIDVFTMLFNLPNPLPSIF